MSIPDTFIGNLARVPQLREVGLALAAYAKAISGSNLHWEIEQWVLRPSNFVTFKIQPRDGSIKLSLRGHPDEFAKLDGLQLRDGMGNGSYSSCKITSTSQLAAAALHIRRAYELKQRGGRRYKRKLVLREEDFV